MFRNRRIRRERRPLGARPFYVFVPNLITILSLCAGFTAIRYAADQQWELAVTLIAASIILDGLDGRAARMLNVQSKLGAELDSLADSLSFGIAPAMILYWWSLHEVKGLGLAVALLLAVCCALRLARFNTQLDDPQRPVWTMFFFQGIPAPGGAAVALSPMMASFVVDGAFFRHWSVVAVVTVFTALMMVSRVPTFSIKKFRIEPGWQLSALVAGAAVAALFFAMPWATIAGACLIYVATIPFSISAARRFQRREDLPVKPEPGEPATQAGGRGDL
ncbi:MAG TPA: CDP-diacylglycerol--serine O-phosphatidyltransferase [Geminicoccus sp.]|jgi:CDP-diacylglycerol--serine O-phosphatidyltransferase|uniref:CDP-diacylglycerol--serine O-phosphatidyltransferase n=1 Tax=Geminicoccus sp. TaxID=2024832 RepID=UPI002E3139E6|nr:CDP-diacylglycerol--serine O-phosphatidyltransferase [Geminicoccus sp.]HEX2524751.1 CDP-diacylglycerol--serine O-phosphatidyltransferase [Geminicoccus sp.]